MLQLSRSLIKRARAVLRRLVPRPEAARAKVCLEGTPDELRLRLHQVEVLAEFREAGSFAPAAVVLPFEALAELEGRADDVVSLTANGEQVLAEWRDGVVPRIKQYEATPIESLDRFPRPPSRMTSAAPGFLQALAAAAGSTARDSLRYALTRIQLRGRTGEIAATDGRQLLLQGGFPLPWGDDLLVPAARVFDCDQLAGQKSIRIGKLEKHVVLHAGAWTFFLPIDDGRFPALEEIVPKPDAVTTSCRIDPEDIAFLQRVLGRLPGKEDDNAPITLDLGDQVVIRAKAAEEERSTELVLARSKASGVPVRVQTNRLLLDRALRLGFTEIGIVSPDAPLVCRDDRRVFLWMPLDKEGALPPQEGALRVVSHDLDLAPETPSPAAPTRRRTMTQEKQNVSDGNGVSRPRSNGTPRRRKSPRIQTLVEEAEKLKALLRDAYRQVHQLTVAIRRQGKQSRLVQATLRSLRALQNVDA